uniref:Sulfatase N-terminal domain-containing protein n=1 Tax=Pyrodinium bahamense TaxID=73915 RepID=A0A7S0FUS0_9DINO
MKPDSGLETLHVEEEAAENEDEEEEAALIDVRLQPVGVVTQRGLCLCSGRGVRRMWVAAVVAAAGTLFLGGVLVLWARSRQSDTGTASIRSMQTALAGASGKNTKPPHLIFVLIDDLGFNDFYHSPDLGVSWPYVNSILKDSILINTTYTEAWCSPSRAALMTGRYYHLLNDHDFSSNETTIAQKLNEVGYMSYAIGKWHLGWESWSMTPLGRGFHRYFGNQGNPLDHYTHCSSESGVDYYDQAYMERYPFTNTKSSMDQPYYAVPTFAYGLYDAVAYSMAARAFIRDHKAKFPEKPFFLYYAMYEDHNPYQADANWKQNCSKVRAEGRKNLCGMQAAADSALQNLTAILQTLTDDDYVLIVTGDNGGMVGKRKKPGWGNNLPLRGAKFLDWEGGIRSRALIWGKHPDLVASESKGKIYTGGIMHLVDWHATLAALGGVAPRSWRYEPSGVSVWRAVLQGAPSPREELFVGSGYDGFGVYRKGDWALIVNRKNFSDHMVGFMAPLYSLPTEYNDTAKDFLQYKATQEKGKVKVPALFNLAEDPGQSKPLYHAEKLAEMTTALESWYSSSGERNLDASGHDQECSECTAALEAAREHATRGAAQAAELAGAAAACGVRVFHPFLDEFNCSCTEITS